MVVKTKTTYPSIPPLPGAPAITVPMGTNRLSHGVTMPVSKHKTTRQTVFKSKKK